MKIKLDENIGRRGLELLRNAGHDVMTVRDQNLQGAADDILHKVCTNEDRVLITLDHDFGQVLRFPPKHSAGLVILEPGARIMSGSIEARLQNFLTAAALRSPVGALWIIEPGRIRIHVSRNG
jgi:predicted nuclease of predicted toxin-antitoxin system